MKLLTKFDQDAVAGMKCLAESNEFAVYSIGDDTYALVHRHEGTEWEGISISGDGVFRVGTLLIDAMRHLYRDTAKSLSEAKHPGT
jgi:hypothetical protein